MIALTLASVILITGSALASASSTSNLACQSDNPRFTLAALNTTMANANGTGVPLSLTIWDQEDAGSEYKLVTSATARRDDGWGSTFTLAGAALFANNNASSAQAWTEGPDPFLTFNTSTDSSASGSVFCETADALAANNHSDLWSLCKKSDKSSPRYVVYNASEEGGAGGVYVFSTCYPVSLTAVAA